MNLQAPIQRSSRGTAIEEMKASHELAHDTVPASEHFSAVRVHNSDKPVSIKIENMRQHRISMKAPGLHMHSLSTLGKRLPDAVIQPGLTSICSAHVDSEFSLEPHEGTNCYFFIDPAHFETIFQDDDPAGRRPELCNIPATTDPFFRSMLSAYLDEFEKAQAFASVALESIALRVGLHLARNYTIPVEAPSPLPAASGEKARIARAKAYIHDNLDKAISLTDIAAAACLSQYHFVRCFKAAEGLTPYQYVIRQRVARAHFLLRETGISIAEISIACGFSSQQHFTDTFRRLCSTTPGAVRREFRG